ncbi:MAG: bifunctional 3-deoxy-7-phosphoheptulonate synthase/chorismate mutase type II [Muribaculaceae bacterium]|nr:bifunctional 3-deoxy-7-phosphoheptulonate synthase/chorismate mutase type II [Muribaculaceae bacterium]
MKDLLPLAIEGTELSRPIIISGPCSAETREQTLETARRLARAGVKIFRAGIWKPRTKPGGFEGVGEKGLPWLREVKETTGMYIATEVATPAHADAAIDAGVDILWIGARTTANPFAMQELADAIAAKNPDISVLVKNPVNPDLELWIGALMRLYNAGVRRLGVIHRGFSTYGLQTYRNHPQWRIPLELRIRYPELPVICDPSHIGGRRELIASLSQQALDMGLDGLIIESHCNPDEAWSDAAQQVTPEGLGVILESLVYRSTPVPAENLTTLRRRIDQLDNELLDVLAKRMNVSREIGEYKRVHGIPVVQSGRFGDIMASRVLAARSMGMTEEFIRTVFSAIHEESVGVQLRDAGSQPASSTASDPASSTPETAETGKK